MAVQVFDLGLGDLDLDIGLSRPGRKEQRETKKKQQEDKARRTKRPEGTGWIERTVKSPNAKARENPNAIGKNNHEKNVTRLSHERSFLFLPP